MKMELTELMSQANVATHTLWDHNEFDLMFAEGNKQEASYLVYGDLMTLVMIAITNGGITVDGADIEVHNDELAADLTTFVIEEFNRVSTNVRNNDA